MPFYHRLGKIPDKKHITFYKDDGESLYREELCSTKGFSGIYSTKYHIHMPTSTLEVKEGNSVDFDAWDDAPLSYYHFFTDSQKKGGDFLSSRIYWLHNHNCETATAAPTKNADYFYRNSHAYEYIFIHRGSGILLSEYGELPFIEGDQIIIPMGTLYQMNFNDFNDNKLLIIESRTPFEFPKHFINDSGQLLEDAPFCERDIKIPEEINPVDQKGKFLLKIKTGKRIFEHTLDHHPFDVVGWDGYLYPYSINIKDYAPKVGKLHLPPPVHLIWVTQHFVLCNFVPRLFDFHPDAIPAPYFHTNVDSAEVLYYVEGDFMSRKGIKEGSITLHPLGLPHGPQPGKTEASVGAKETFEYAVMLDTFEPLHLTKNVIDAMDKDYFKSWIE